MSYADWSARIRRGHGGRVAIVDATSDARIPYDELDERACRVAVSLVERFGIGRGDRVAVLASNRIEHADLYFAVQKIGAILVPLNWRLAPPEMAVIASDCLPRLLVHELAMEAGARAMREAVDGMALSRLDSGPEDPDGYQSLLSGGSGAPPEAPGLGATDPQMILYTSGTTGHPKGVVITHGQILANSINTGLACDLVSTDSTVTYTPFFHTGGWHVLSTPLWHRGGTVVVMRSFDAGALLELIERERITTLFGVPTPFQMLAEHPTFRARDLSSVRFCLCGGAPCPPWLIESYAERGLEFRQGFGLTEVGPNCFSLPPEDARRKAGSVGKPVVHWDARIVGEDGRPVVPGRVGELELSGPHVTVGYWRRSEATGQALRDGWFRTGDLACVDEDGYYRISGRAKDMYISGGENVYPAEVENALASHPSIRDVAIYAVGHPRWGEVGRAVVVVRDGQELSEREVLSYLGGRVAGYKIPKSVVFARDLPRNPSGKVLKAELSRLFGA